MSERRGLEFWILTAFFAVFVLFLYGPLSAILILSFQGPNGGLTFPLNGVSLHWFANLTQQQAVGDFGASFRRSLTLGVMVMLVTVVVSLLAGLAFRRKFFGATPLFYLAIASLVVPSIIISLGIGVMFQQIGSPSYEEAARDLGATSWQTFRHVLLPMIAPMLVGVGLFGFTLSYDEFARTLMTAGTYNTLPLEIYGMTTNVTTPVLYALGTVTTVFSFLVIAVTLGIIVWLGRRSAKA
jgi:putative spermidine/putrescine transport system permease protein